MTKSCEGTPVHDLLDQSWPPKSKFSVEDIPDLTGRVVIVTGANTGIGKATAKALLAHNAKVYIAARNQQKSTQAIEDLKAETEREAIFLKLDLADLESVKAAAEEFLSRETELHILFNNGGVMTPPLEDLTVQGYDLQFGTNVLGHFYFTKLLLPTLLSTAQNRDLPKGTVRVVNTSSDGHLFTKSVDYHTLKDGPARRKLGAVSLYSQSKLGNVLFAQELARRYGPDAEGLQYEHGIISTALNPGHLETDLQRNTSKLVKGIIGPLMLHPAPLGALTQLWAGTSPEGAELNGQYLKPWARMGKASKVTEDTEMAKRLWEYMEGEVARIGAYRIQ